MERVTTLYTTAVSANGRKALALARHLGLDLRVETVHVYRGEGQAAAYRTLNPWGKVPTLVDGDFVLWESNAILVYLSEHLGGGALSPPDARGRADLLRWMFWESAHWQPTLSRVLAPRVAQLLFPSPDAAPTPVPWDDRELGALLAVLGAALEAGGYVCGPELSLADFSLAGMTTYFAATGFPGQEHPAIAAWLGRMSAVPAWASTAVAPWT
ncbi:MAG: glutathione S-transferase family protein [Polyangiaceae bacterium]|nr:glutathione S-transferase family protein [Polyangiaceae bacterium]